MRPEMIRFTPNGGRAWKCAYCDRYACDQSLQGVFLCQCHGGSTPRQRDTLLRQIHFEATGQWPRRPGRPMRHGWYSRYPKVKVTDIVAEYRKQRRLDTEAFRKKCTRFMH